MRSPVRSPIVTALILILACAAAGSAGFLPPRRHGWRTIETAHFQFYFYDRTEPMARRLAPSAERVHDRLVAELRMEPSQITHVVICDTTDAANGAAVVMPRNTILLYATSDYAGGFGRVGDTLLETFTHEYTHVLQMGHVTSLPQAINVLVGDILFPNMFLPPWCIEGLAVAMESEFHRSGRLHSSTWRMLLRADFLESRILSWPQVSNGVYRWPYTNSWYLYGSYFIRYLIDRFGQDKVMRLFHSTGGDLPYLSFSECFRATFGLQLDEAVAEWRNETARHFRLEAERIVAEGLVEGRPLAVFGGRSGQGDFGPDGRLFFMQRSYDTPARLRVAEPPYDKTEVIGGLSAGRPAVSRDGRRLAFGLSSWHGDSLFSELYVRDLNTGRTTMLSRGQRATDPTWSPDGGEIAFIGNSPPNFSLHRIRVTDGAVTPIHVAKGSDQAFSPSWSPRGDRIAFVRYRTGDGLRIWLIRPDGTDLTPLHDGPALSEELDPAWSADGRYLYFAADPTGVFNIYAYDLEERTLWRVTNVLTGAYAPAAAPDGKTLAYTGYASSGYDQYVMALDPASWRPFVRNAPAMGDPVPGFATSTPPRFFFASAPPADTPAQPYSPWKTLEPMVGYVAFGADTTGGSDFEVAMSGVDVLETVAYTLGLNRGSNGLGYEARVDLRLAPFTLTLASGLDYDEPIADEVSREQYHQVLLRGAGSGLLMPNDRLSWSVRAYQENLIEQPAAEEETHLGLEVAAAYDRTASYNGAVSLVTGYRFGGAAGVEELRETGATTWWKNAWGRLYLPIQDRSRLELAIGLDHHSGAEALVDLGGAEIPSPSGILTWDAEAVLESPLTSARDRRPCLAHLSAFSERSGRSTGWTGPRTGR